MCGLWTAFPSSFVGLYMSSKGAKHNGHLPGKKSSVGLKTNSAWARWLVFSIAFASYSLLHPTGSCAHLVPWHTPLHKLHLITNHNHCPAQQGMAVAWLLLSSRCSASHSPPFSSPASPFPSLLPSWLLRGSREREKGIIYCMPVENERLLHFNEH